jgi:hypothetical protein
VSNSEPLVSYTITTGRSRSLTAVCKTMPMEPSVNSTEHILPLANIVRVVDEYQDLTHPREAHLRLHPNQALAELYVKRRQTTVGEGGRGPHSCRQCLSSRHIGGRSLWIPCPVETLMMLRRDLRHSLRHAGQRLQHFLAV